MGTGSLSRIIEADKIAAAELGARAVGAFHMALLALRESRIRVLLVDDHPVVRSGLRVIGTLEPQIEITGEAGTAADAIAAVQAMAPDVILLDIRLPDGSGIDVCRQAKSLHPQVKVICRSSFSSASLVLSAMAAGADGYLLKQSVAERIINAIRTVVTGEPSFDELVKEPSRDSTAAGTERLAPAERRVLEQAVRGLTDKEIALTLNLSPKTVRNCLDRSFAKLGVHNRTQAVVAFVRELGTKKV